ncbi:hypothetical protein E2C01_091189 [Portunus trituberculatus]|uniref:Uncharacterized protein n=1 Tax=Portunus trituberculatus TaxID=210409 RepID=A0A5B7JMB8_PORTR|nr:hypothetical protein [Portunus trituberculatus]
MMTPPPSHHLFILPPSSPLASRSLTPAVASGHRSIPVRAGIVLRLAIVTHLTLGEQFQPFGDNFPLVAPSGGCSSRPQAIINAHSPFVRLMTLALT